MYRSGTATLTALTLLAGGVLAVGAAPTAAAVPVGPPCAVGAPLQTDFDGDGKADLVVGGSDAGEPVSRAHWVSPGDGGPAYWILDTGELRSADLNGDVCADALLFAGGHEPWLKAVPGTPDGLDPAAATDLEIPQAEDVADDERRSLEFEAAGLRHDGLSQVAISGRHVIDLEEDGPEDYSPFVDLLTLDDSLGVAASQEIPFGTHANGPWNFGSALATSGRTVAVGAPSATVNGKTAAGLVLIYTTDTADPTRLVLRKTLTQNSAGVPGAAEDFDHFGATLAMRAGRLAIGAPGESDGRLWASGLVQPIRWKEATATYTAYRAITQDTSGVPGSNEKDDNFGAHLAIARGLTAAGSYDILIGANEKVGKKVDAGSVTVANFTRSLYRTYTQSSSGIPGNPQSGDDFSRVGVLQGSAGVDTVLIGAPGETTNGIEDYGRAIRSNARKLTSKTTWTNIAVAAGAPAGLRRWGLDFAAA